jgi:hypothetical protein
MLEVNHITTHILFKRYCIAIRINISDASHIETGTKNILIASSNDK